MIMLNSEVEYFVKCINVCVLGIRIYFQSGMQAPELRSTALAGTILLQMSDSFLFLPLSHAQMHT